MTDPGKKQDQPKDPRDGYHSGPFPEQVQEKPGLTAPMEPQPDHGEESYEGEQRASGQGGADNRRRLRHRQGCGHSLRP